MEIQAGKLEMVFLCSKGDTISECEMNHAASIVEQVKYFVMKTVLYTV